jgi:hypothetical protein
MPHAGQEVAAVLKLSASSLAVVLVSASGCGGPQSPSLVGDGEEEALVAVQPSAPTLKSMMVCRGKSLELEQRYEVYAWSDGSVLASCEVFDAQRHAAGTRFYSGEEDTAEAAWALCHVELAEQLPGARSSTWRFASHRALNAAGVTYGTLEPGFGLVCEQVQVPWGGGSAAR